jgi:hypothetical protein
MPNRIAAGAAKAQPNSHREAKATAPVLDSTSNPCGGTMSVIVDFTSTIPERGMRHGAQLVLPETRALDQSWLSC